MTMNALIRAVTQAFVFRFRARTVGQRSADCCYLSHTATFCYFFDPNELFGGETAVEARRRRVKRFRSENQLQNTKIKCVTISSIDLSNSVLSSVSWRHGSALHCRKLERAPPAAMALSPLTLFTHHVPTLSLKKLG